MTHDTQRDVEASQALRRKGGGLYRAGRLGGIFRALA